MTVSLKQPLALTFAIVGITTAIAAAVGPLWGGGTMAVLGVLLLWASD